jgi:hypothetical protein
MMTPITGHLQKVAAMQLSQLENAVVASLIVPCIPPADCRFVRPAATLRATKLPKASPKPRSIWRLLVITSPRCGILLWLLESEGQLGRRYGTPGEVEIRGSAGRVFLMRRSKVAIRPSSKSNLRDEIFTMKPGSGRRVFNLRLFTRTTVLDEFAWGELTMFDVLFCSVQTDKKSSLSKFKGVNGQSIDQRVDQSGAVRLRRARRMSGLLQSPSRNRGDVSLTPLRQDGVGCTAVTK